MGIHPPRGGYNEPFWRPPGLHHLAFHLSPRGIKFWPLPAGHGLSSKGPERPGEALSADASLPELNRSHFLRHASNTERCLSRPPRLPRASARASVADVLAPGRNSDVHLPSEVAAAVRGT